MALATCQHCGLHLRLNPTDPTQVVHCEPNGTVHGYRSTHLPLPYVRCEHAELDLDDPSPSGHGRVLACHHDGPLVVEATTTFGTVRTRYCPSHATEAIRADDTAELAMPTAADDLDHVRSREPVTPAHDVPRETSPGADG